MSYANGLISESVDESKLFMQIQGNCPMCQKQCRAFHCVKCLQTKKVANDTSSYRSWKSKEHYRERLTSGYSTCEKHYNNCDVAKSKHLADLIADAEHRNDLLKNKIKKCKEIIEQDKEKIEECTKSNKMTKRKLRAFMCNLDKFSTLFTELSQRISKRESDWLHLKKLVFGHIHKIITQMLQGVFELGIAVDYLSVPSHYKIGEAQLPLDGAHDSFFITDEMSVEGMKMNNNNIKCGLSHLCQLISAIASTCCIDLPHPVHFLEFLNYTGPVQSEEFGYLAWKLKANVYYFCISQKCPPDMLVLQNALHNLTTMLKDKCSVVGNYGWFDFAGVTSRALPNHDGLIEEELLADLDGWEEVSFVVDTVPFMHPALVRPHHF